mmetsp:Transcript_8945/g.27106  ORF Transcript_8945/g.27106 Transcript_8945/m.27106 type:complete len:265 (+) Transcript_8945:799-1593(+)
MLHGAVFPEVPVPPELVRDAVPLHVPLKDLDPFLPGAASHQLPHSRHKQVHCGHGLAVLVQPHVKSLDVLGVVRDEERAPAEGNLAQPSLVLRLQVRPPLDLELKVAFPIPLCLHQQVDGLRVGDPVPHARGKPAQHLGPRLGSLGSRRGGRGVQEVQVLRPLLQDTHQAVLDVGFRASDDVVEAGKGELGLQHPELREVPVGVRVLRPKRRAEGVHVAQGASVRLCLQLAGHREKGRAAEKVVLVSFLAGGGLLQRLALPFEL